MKLKVLDTALMSSRLRTAAIDVPARRLLVTNFHGTKQEQDLTEPANCGGIGRIRHFRRRATLIDMLRCLGSGSTRGAGPGRGRTYHAFDMNILVNDGLPI
jgi:hypothetical protein